MVTGRADTASGGGDFALARYNADGSLDTTFGAAGTGVVYADNQGRADTAASCRSVLARAFGKGESRNEEGMSPLADRAIRRR